MPQVFGHRLQEASDLALQTYTTSLLFFFYSLQPYFCVIFYDLDWTYNECFFLLNRYLAWRIGFFHYIIIFLDVTGRRQYCNCL